MCRVRLFGRRINIVYRGSTGGALHMLHDDHRLSGDVLFENGNQSPRLQIPETRRRSAAENGDGFALKIDGLPTWKNRYRGNSEEQNEAPHNHSPASFFPRNCTVRLAKSSRLLGRMPITKEFYQRSLPIAQRSRLARYSRNNTMRIATARRTRSWRSSVVA